MTTAADIARDYPIHDALDGWFFRVDEVSANVYSVEGRDLSGRSVSRMGTDPEALLAECVQDALAFDS